MELFTALKRHAFGSQRAIPSLDGLRAISISFVLLAHLTGTRGFPAFPAIERLGHFGVRVFFVISGYLITCILLGELRRTGSVCLPRFYFRRTLRLFPASYFLIAVVAVLAAAGRLQLHRWDFTFAVTYTMNYYDARGWNLGHLWSLAVEEQFYLLWPATLRVLRPARAMRLLVGIMIAAPLIRLASPYLGPAVNFLTIADALATGCLLASLRSELFDHSLYRKILLSKWFFLVPLAGVTINYTPSTKVYWLVGETIMNVAVAMSIDWAMRNADGRVGRVLNWPAVSFVGVLSYSLYLWQQPFLNRECLSPLCSFPWNLLLVLVMAILSYLCIEAPFLRLRTRWETTLFPKLRGPRTDRGEDQVGAPAGSPQEAAK